MIPRFNDTVDDCNRICPYCEHHYQVEVEDYDEDEQEEKCDQCGKLFYACDEFSVSHHAKPDCELNKEEHAWAVPVAYKGRSYLHCETCGKCRSEG